MGYATDAQGDLRAEGDVRPIMEHQDIIDLIVAGELTAALALFEARGVKGGISSHDRQTLEALLDKAKDQKAKTKAQPGPIKEEAEAEAPAATVESRPSVSRSSGRGRNPLGGKR